MAAMTERADLTLKPPQYPWKGEYQLLFQNYIFQPISCVDFLLAGPYGEVHSVNIAPIRRGLARFKCHEVNLTFSQLELLTYRANSGEEDQILCLKLSIKQSAISQAIHRAKESSAIDDLTPGINQFIIRLDRLGLTHPDFLPWVLNKFFIPK